MQLRDATRAAHQALDDLIGAWPDVAAYRRYLSSQRRFRAAVDAVDLTNCGLDWTLTPLATALAADCADLGLGAGQGAAVATLARPRDRSEALGLCYVVEGSALGARLLHARAAELGLDERFAARHLAIQAESQRWRDFLALLEAAEPFALERAAATANAAFAAAALAFGTSADV